MTMRKHGSEPTQWLERAAAASLGCAAGFAFFEYASWRLTSAFAAGVFGGLSVFAITLSVLKMIAVERHPHRSVEAPPAFQRSPGAQDLFLRLQDVLADASAAERDGDELLLEDALELPGDSRVVQLFHGAPMPTAAELLSRIDQHLECNDGVDPTHADDSAALFNALESLKRSLG